MMIQDAGKDKMQHEAVAVSSRQREWVWTARVTLVVFVLLLSRALTRPLDLDEHQFIAPSLLYNLEHLRPYVDYPTVHMPLLVYIYAAILHLSSNALLVTRVFSAIIGTLCVMLVYRTSRAWLRNAPERVARGVALSLVAIHITARVFTYTNGWAWNHDASIAALLAAVLLHLHAVRTCRVSWFVLVGVLLGAAVSIRLTTAPAAGVLGLCGLFLASQLSSVQRIVACVLALAGATVALLPTWWLYKAAPQDFVFCNLEVAGLYKQYVLSGNTQQTTLIGKIGHFFQTWFTDPGNAAAAGLVGYSLFRILKTRAYRGIEGSRIATLSLLCVALWIGLSLPFQTQMQYHSVLLPFFLLLIAAAVSTATGRWEELTQWYKIVTIAAICAAVVNVPRWYWQVYKLATPTAWTSTRAIQWSVWVRDNVPADGRVLTIDPLLPLQAGVRVFPQYATGRLTLHFGPFMAPEARRARQILCKENFDEVIAAHPPAAVLYKTSLEGLAAQLKGAGERLGFVKLVSPDGEYTLWVPPRRS